jgi:hypothetical protein
MPESAEEVYARVVALLPSYDGAEHARSTADGADCFSCGGEGGAVRVWENDRWKLSRAPQAPGMPLVLGLASRKHLDYADMDDAMAAEYGRISVWLCRIISRLRDVGRVHVCRWGDESGHLQVWFVARATQAPVPEDIWLEDVSRVATKLANHDGRALV